MEDNKKWSEFLDEAFGAQESIPQEPLPQSPASQEEQILTPSEETPPVPRKRRLWPAFAITAVLVAVAVLLFLPRETPSPELQMCKDALKQWQSYENYRIMVQHSQYGDIMVTPGYEEYLRYGDNRIEYRYSTADAAAPTFSGTMLKDGQYYQFYTEGNFIQNPFIVWQPTTLFHAFQDPWPMQFEWNIEKILHHQAQYYDSGALKTVQLTINETNANGSFSSYSPFTAYFNFLQTGTLETVTLHLVKRSNGRYETAGMRVITYIPTAFDSDQIKDDFQILVSPNTNS